MALRQTWPSLGDTCRKKSFGGYWRVPLLGCLRKSLGNGGMNTSGCLCLPCLAGGFQMVRWGPKPGSSSEDRGSRFDAYIIYGHFEIAARRIWLGTASLLIVATLFTAGLISDPSAKVVDSSWPKSRSRRSYTALLLSADAPAQAELLHRRRC